MAEFTPEAFNALLAWLDHDRDRAGERYNTLRHRLIVFFEGRNCSSESDGLADRTLDVVARKLREGQNIHSSESFGYCFGVARNILRERLHGPKLYQLDIQPASPNSEASEHA